MMNNNIPQGYKESPLGVIPQDWEVRRLGEVCRVNQGLQIPIEKRLIKPTANSYKYITIQYLNSAKDAEYIINPTDSVVCDEDDVLMTRTGNTGIVVTNVSGVFHNNFFKINFDRKIITKNFLVPYLRQDKTHHQILVKAGTSTIPDLNHKDFYSIYFPIPPLAEQERIAEVLGTWDEAIDKQSQLVKTLERRKRALMQQLLTARKRLPNFSAPWKEVKLREIFNEIKDTDDGQGVYSAMTISAKEGLISQQSKFDRVIAGDSLKRYTLIQQNDFAYNKGNSKSYKMGCVYRLTNHTKVLVPFVYICFRCKNGVDYGFYEQWFRNHGLDRALMKIITSGARGDGLLNVNTSDFFNIFVPNPALEEQKAIAQILTTADKEIELATQKLETLRTQKRALMQQLLTGKKRLKI